MTGPAQSRPLTEEEWAAIIREENRRYFEEERRRDAELLEAYARECAGSWDGRETKARLA